jgi:hypothetical protein
MRFECQLETVLQELGAILYSAINLLSFNAIVETRNSGGWS